MRDILSTLPRVRGSQTGSDVMLLKFGFGRVLAFSQDHHEDSLFITRPRPRLDPARQN